MEAELFNGEVERGEGSGFLIGDSTVVTDSHVIPRLNDYRRVSITIRLGRRAATPVDASLAGRDGQADLAVLHLASPQVIAQPICPIESFANFDSAPEGTELVVLGYPVGRDMSVTGGILSNQEEEGRWQTDATMNVGNSGGPVFDLNGYLLGFAVAGMTWYGDEDNGHFVSGVNFFIPVARVLSSSVAAALQAPPPCWQLADAPAQEGTLLAHVDSISSNALGAISSVASSKGGGHATTSSGQHRVADADRVAHVGRDDPPLEALLQELPREVPISVLKDDHPGLLPSSKSFIRTIRADPGYKIEACSVDSASANNAQQTQCTVSPDGTSAEFRTTLTSGPFFDRWRAWWHGEAVLKQRLVGQ